MTCRISILIGIIRESEDTISIQQDINELQNWAKTWQMYFNYEKCKVMHFERKNTENEYTMDLGENLIPHKIEKTLVEKGSRNLAGKRP